MVRRLVSLLLEPFTLQHRLSSWMMWVLPCGVIVASLIDITFLKVLAALDVHTARWIVDKCFKGDLIRGRTVLLVVSHALALTSDYLSLF